MIGVDPAQVSDCVRGTGATNENEFKIATNISRVTTSPQSNFDTYAKYSDSLSASIIGLEIEQRTWAWNSTPDKKYVIWEYVIKNNSTTTYTSMYAGICSDWDIDATTFANNKSAYDAANKLGYSWCTDPGGKYAGVKLLTSHAPANFYAMDNVAGGGGGINSNDGYDTQEKYNTLSTSRLTAGNTSAAGNDVINVMSSGPYSIAPGQHVVVAFALIAGDHLPDLQAGAAAAQIKYNGVASPISVQEINFGENRVLVFPNPAADKLNISLAAKEESEVSVYDQTGRLVYREKVLSSLSIPTQNWSKGIYFVKVNGKGSVATTKIVLQ